MSKLFSNEAFLFNKKQNLKLKYVYFSKSITITDMLS